MKIDLHPSDSRGVAEHGWLHSRHSFSFADYYNPDRMEFGMLRVLNDDIVEAGQGFGIHPHANMEIVTVVLEGTLEHKDSEGNHGIIPAGDVQKMSAGTGIRHSEFNASKKDPVHLLQIWVQPNKNNIKPNYDQKSFSADMKKNKLLPIVSNQKSKDAIHIHQDSVFLLGSLDKDKSVSYKLTDLKHGVYVFVIKGSLSLGRNKLADGDAAAVSQADEILLTAEKKTDVLVIEVPLK